jgi:hypothetical protein
MREITYGVSPPRIWEPEESKAPPNRTRLQVRNLAWSSPSTAGRYGEHRTCQNFSSQARERSLSARILGVEYLQIAAVT